MSFVRKIQELDRTQLAFAGGKGAHLGELARIAGVRVPTGFCITTQAFRRTLAAAPGLDTLLDRLARLAADDRDAIREHSAKIRQVIEATPIPDDVAAAIRRALAELGEQAAYAVRSSATAEDLPAASFAGQQDTYLDVIGPAAILEHVSRCWGSLFTERAVTYRLRNGFAHAKVDMAVIVQRMVRARSAGVLFTADPITSNRKVTAIEAVPGLGEALVSGLVNADVARVRGDDIIARTVRHVPPVLSDSQIVELAQLGRRIEAHFGTPQDIEWCVDADGFQFVQSRPITTLFPIPAAADGDNHVYMSVGHQQMMTDAMKPLGLAMFLLITPAPMKEAGGRLFVDVTQRLASPASRAALLDMAGKSDPLTLDALKTILDRDFVRPQPDARPGATPARTIVPLDPDPAIVEELIEQNQASVAALKRDIEGKSGPALFDFILADLAELKRILFDPRSHRVFMTAIEATWWLDEHLRDWLGETGAADTLAQSVPHNVTSEMGLALLDVADAIRPHPAVVAYLQRVTDDSFLDVLPTLDGGREARDALCAYLDKYGMRGAAEIDITRPRWSERPTTLVPLLLANIKNFVAGAAHERFARGRDQAGRAELDLLRRLRALPEGEHKAAETKLRIDRVRAFIGYREYPKYGMVSRTFLYRQALLREAERLVEAGVLGAKEDCFYLTFQELHEVARTHQIDHELIRQRAEAFETYRMLTPPRVLTSEGEGLSGAYRRGDLPAGALVGLAVSAGTVEGRARVILDMADAVVEPGDILVTAFTDPSWTPLFIGIAGLVTEVGGLMTHGAVIAREYGLPAVVGVDGATRRIRDGQRIRVDGTGGYVELLS
jgi:rifampicin phosphotransferase